MTFGKDEHQAKVLDNLMADVLVGQVFMLEMSLELARQQPEPQAWARRFISKMQERVDGNARGVESSRFPAHELARQRLEQRGQELYKMLERDQRASP